MTKQERELIRLEGIAEGARRAADAADFATKTGRDPVEEAKACANIQAQEHADLIADTLTTHRRGSLAHKLAAKQVFTNPILRAQHDELMRDAGLGE